jgi:V/A-type H+-transporting ATPase subunit D
MELIKLRRRIALAQKGHDLLKEKMDALVMEFFAVLRDIEQVRETALAELQEAFERLSRCQAEVGTVETMQAILEMEREASVEIRTRYLMGVQVPKIELKHARRGVGYSVHATTAAFDRAVEAFTRVLAQLVRLAELEAAAYALARELERTKRRVNALEYVVLPGLREMIKFIQNRLDEIERENFARLKRIKSVIEKKRE